MHAIVILPFLRTCNFSNEIWGIRSEISLKLPLPQVIPCKLLGDFLGAQEVGCSILIGIHSLGLSTWFDGEGDVTLVVTSGVRSVSLVTFRRGSWKPFVLKINLK